MSDESLADALDVAGFTADTVSAYISCNPVPEGELPALIGTVNGSIRDLELSQPNAAERIIPPVPVKKSITPDHLLSLEDGNPYRTLKRHLARLGLAPDQYRTKWGLQGDGPMNAPNNRRGRSEAANARGF